MLLGVIQSIIFLFPIHLSLFLPYSTAFIPIFFSPTISLSSFLFSHIGFCCWFLDFFLLHAHSWFGYGFFFFVYFSLNLLNLEIFLVLIFGIFFFFISLLIVWIFWGFFGFIFLLILWILRFYWYWFLGFFFFFLKSLKLLGIRFWDLFFRLIFSFYAHR